MTGALIDLGLCGYDAARELQLKFVEELKRGCGKECLILCEHNNVFTVGRRGARENILVSDSFLEEKGIDLRYVERGGDVTYHGPGQLVIYPVLDLKKRKKDILLFLNQLEDIAKGLIGLYGLRGRSIKGLRGVWVGGKKVAAIGVSFRNWISFHGMSVNLNCDMKLFGLINPCGIKGGLCASVSELTGASIDIEGAKKRAAEVAAAVFDTKWIEDEKIPLVA